MSLPAEEPTHHSVVLSESGEQQLDELMERYGLTCAQAIEKAIALLDHVAACQDDGWIITGVKYDSKTQKMSHLERLEDIRPR